MTHIPGHDTDYPVPPPSFEGGAQAWEKLPESGRSLIWGMAQIPGNFGQEEERFLGIPDNDFEATRTTTRATRSLSRAEAIRVIPDFEDMTPAEQASAVRDYMSRVQGPPRISTTTTTVPPRYTRLSVLQDFTSLDPVTRVRVQEDLVSLGLIVGEYTPGQLEPIATEGSTRWALEYVMGVANINGTSWTEAMLDLHNSGFQGLKANTPPPPGFTFPAYTPPDPARVNQDIKQLTSDMFGDAVSIGDSELDYLRDQFERAFRERYESDRTTAAAEHDARITAAETGQDVTFTPGPAVDPAARFAEVIEERFAAKTAHQKQVGETAANRDLSHQIGQSILSFATGRGR